MNAAHEHRTFVDISDDLDLLTEQLDALIALGAEEHLADNRRYDFSIRWGTALAGRLPRLVHFSCAGRLDDVDESRFQALCARLREQAGLIDRLGLAQPVFTDPRPAKSKHHRPPHQRVSKRGWLRRGRQSREMPCQEG